jgi:hypothetical protein
LLGVECALTRCNCVCAARKDKALKPDRQLTREPQIPLAAPASDTAEVLSFFTFIKNTVAGDLELLTPALDMLSRPSGDDYSQIALRTSQHLRLLADLAEALGGGMGREDRILITQLVEEQLETLAKPALSRQVECSIDTPQNRLGPIYGNRKWLNRALHAYLSRMLVSVPRGARINLNVYQTGVFMVLSTQWHLPKALPDEMESQAGYVFEALPLALARTILEVHGGRAKIMRSEESNAAPEALDGFVINLPTGASTTQDWNLPCPYQDCLVRRQLDLFAADLSIAVSSNAAHHLKGVESEKGIDR